MCDIDKDKTSQDTGEFGVSRYYIEYREMSEQGNIDVSIVVTPDQALRVNLSLVYHPFSLTLKEAHLYTF